MALATVFFIAPRRTSGFQITHSKASPLTLTGLLGTFASLTTQLGQQEPLRPLARMGSVIFSVPVGLTPAPTLRPAALHLLAMPEKS